MDPFFLFLKKPAASIGQTQRTPIFILFLFYLGLAVFFGLTGYLIYLSKTDIQSILLTKISGYSLVEKVLKVIILAPVIEEILFRLLLRFNHNTVRIFFAVTISYCIYLIFHGKYTILMVLSGFQILLLASIWLRSIDQIKSFVENYFTTIFYISVLLFGLIHISNFEFSSASWFYLPLLVIPQLIAGTMLGHIRISYSFMHGIAFHMLINLTVLLK